MDISVIVPIYKGKQYVDHIVKMIHRNQDYLRKNRAYLQIEIIFVNDYPEEEIYIACEGNMDVTVSFLANERNEGIHRTRIKGLHYSKGEYILFLDQDDEIVDEYFFEQIRQIGTADGVLCNGVYRGNKLIFRNTLHQKEAVTLATCLSQKSMIVSPGQVLLKKKSIPKEWVENVLYENGHDDAFLWMLMLEKHAVLSINEQVLYQHIEKEGENTSGNFGKMKKAAEELQDLLKNNKLLSPEHNKMVLEAWDYRIYKYNSYLAILSQWEGLVDSIAKRTQNRKLALYGWGVIGKKLYYELTRKGVEISCVIDKDAPFYHETEVCIITLDELKESPDFILVTAAFDYRAIETQLKKKVSCEIVPIIKC